MKPFKLICLFICFASITIKGQNKVIYNENVHAPSRILYKGLINLVDFGHPSIKKTDMVVYCNDFKIIDSIGQYYIKIDKKTLKSSTTIKLKNKHETMWSDSLIFKIKECGNIRGQFGPIANGSKLSPKLAVSIAKRLYVNSDCLNAMKLKAKIISYKVSFFDPANLEICQRVIFGPEIDKSVMRYLHLSRSRYTMEFDNIKTVVQMDTFFVKPLTYIILGDSLKDFILEITDSKRTLVIHSINDFNKDSVYGNLKILKRIVGHDTVVIAQRYDSLNQVIRFKRYYLERPSQLKLEVNKISDSTYYIKYYDTLGVCIAEGKSMNSIFDIKNTMLWEDGTPIVFSNTLDSLHCFMYEQTIMPCGEWKFYSLGGNILASGSFKPGNDIETSYSATSHSLDFHRQYCFMTGTWRVYNTNGKTIQVKAY